MPANFLSVHNRLGTLLSVSFGLFHLIITLTQLSGYFNFILQRKKLRIRQMGHFSEAPQLLADEDRIRGQAFILRSLHFHPMLSTALWSHGGSGRRGWGGGWGGHLPQLKPSQLRFRSLPVIFPPLQPIYQEANQDGLWMHHITHSPPPHIDLRSSTYSISCFLPSPLRATCISFQYLEVSDLLKARTGSTK